MWIGLLYGMICLAAQYEAVSEGKSSILGGQALRDPLETVSIFREKMIQCLVLGNYTEPGPYTVETLIMYYISDHFRTSDTQFGAWMVFGLIVRAAMRLGLHLDASNFPRISVFRGEMQRRLWASIVHLDLQTSIQVGLPRMVREGMYNTQPPRNLLDEDFDEHSKVLPPSRPDGEITNIGYSNAKHKISTVFGIIVDQANSTSPVSYEDVMKLDKKLHDVNQEVPESLRYAPSFIVHVLLEHSLTILRVHLMLLFPLSTW
jgi:hypothetical protein